MSETDMRAALSAPFPPNAIEQREGAHGKMLDYIATETVIRRLNRVCPEWSFRRSGHEWTEPVEWTDKYQKARVSRTLVVWGEMTIPGLGTRSGTGVQVVEDGRSGEDLIKGALSDCLKNCAKLFGVGIDLYGPDLEAGELPARTASPVPPRSPGTSQNVVPPGKPQARAGVPVSDKQLGMIGGLARGLGMSDPQLHQFAGFDSLNDLDRAGASELIERLQELGARAAEGRPEPQAASGGAIVGWTPFWERARALGFRDKAQAEAAIGALGPDPQQALDRLTAWAADNARQAAMVS